MFFSNLVLGTAQLGFSYGLANKTGQPDFFEVVEIVREAWKNGIREFDTAQGYGESEAMLGKALSELGISQEARVITKFAPNLDHLNSDALAKSLDESLARLGVPALFGIMLHKEELLSFWGEGLGKILRDFVLSGKVKYVGVSVYSPEKAVDALNTEGVDLVQLPTNILDRRFENAGIFDLADKKGKQVYIRSVFLQGLILMSPDEASAKLAFAKPVLKKLESLSEELRLTRQEIALGYLKSETPHAKVIFGAEIKDQVTQNIKAWQKGMPELLGNQIRTIFADADEQILNPVVWFKKRKGY